MNILVLAKYAGESTPAIIYVHEQVKELQALGHNVSLITPKPLFKGTPKIQVEMKCLVDGVTYYVPNYFSLSNFGEYSFNNWTYYQAVRRAMKQIKSDGFVPEIIHSHTFSAPSYAGLRLQEILDIPCVITTHGGDLRVPMSHGKDDMVIQKSLQADSVVAVSQKLSETLVSLDERIRPEVIINGYQLIEFENTNKQPYLITSVGHLKPDKNFDVTIRSFSNVLPAFPESRLQIIGYGVMEEKLRELCLELGVTDRVDFRGFLTNEEVMKELNRSTIFALPSVREAFGIVYLEAMSQKCIVIATEGEGFSDLATHDVNCLLVEPGSVDSLTDMMMSIFSQPAKYAKVAEAGYRLALNYSWTKNASHMVELFDELIRRKSGVIQS